jgi:hypothetical protein
MISRPAIEPAISTLPVKSRRQLADAGNARHICNQLTDLVWVSAPRNKTTRCYSFVGDDGTYHAGAFWLPAPEIPDGHDARLRAFCLRESGKLFDLTE